MVSWCFLPQKNMPRVGPVGPTARWTVAAKSKTASRIARTTWGFRQSEEGAKSTEDRAGNQTWQLEIYGISDMDMIQGVYFNLF